MAADGAIIIDTEIETYSFKSGSKELEAAAKRMAKSVTGIGDSAKIAMQKQVNAFTKQNQLYATQEKKVESLKEKIKETAQAKIETSDYKNLNKEIAKLESSLDKAIEKQIRFMETGGKQDSRAFKQMEYDINSLNQKLDQACAKKEQLEVSGKAYTVKDTSGMEERLSVEQQKLRQMNNALGLSFDSLKAKISAHGGSINAAVADTERLKGGYVSLRESVSMAVTTMKARILSLGASMRNGMLHPVQTLKTASTKVFSSMIKTIQKLGQSIKKAASNMKLFNKSTKAGKMSMGKMLLSSLLFSGVFRALSSAINGIKTGMNNLAQYSTSTNATLSTLKSSLTQLKNSLATAFSPILTAIAPALTSFINMLSRAITYVGMFFAAITGQKSFTKAAAVQEDYAAGLDNTASSAEDAKKALEGYLSPIDEINKMDKNDTSESSGSGGGGGVSPSQMFETTDIPSSISDLAEKIKEAWKNADFTEIGNMVGKKLKNALDNIDWDGIKEKARKIAKSIGTFINGFVKTEGLWNSIGRTLAEGVNTALVFLKTFLDTVDWKAIGKGFTTGISSFFANIDWSLLGGTISSAFIALFNLCTGLFSGIDWRALPQSIINAITEFFTGFDWKGTFKSVGELIGSAVAAGIDLVKGLADVLGNVAKDVKNFFVKKFEEAGYEKDGDLIENGKAILTGLLNGIIEGITGIGTWIKENIFDPFIEGFKKAFEIHSPSKVMKTMGNYIVDGLKAGITEKWTDIKEYWSKKKDELINTYKDIKDKFKEKGKLIVSGIKLGILAMWSGFIDFWGKKKDAIVDKFKNIKDSMNTVGKNIVNGIIAGIQEVWSTLTSWAQKIIDLFTINVNTTSNGTSASSGSTGSGGTSTSSEAAAQTADVSWYARGGLFSSASIIGVGEAGKETVLPLENKRTMRMLAEAILSNMPMPYMATGTVIPTMAVNNQQSDISTTLQSIAGKMSQQSMLGNGSGDSNYRFTANINRKTIFDEMISEAKLRQSQNGRNPFQLA